MCLCPGGLRPTRRGSHTLKADPAFLDRVGRSDTIYDPEARWFSTHIARLDPDDFVRQVTLSWTLAFRWKEMRCESLLTIRDE